MTAGNCCLGAHLVERVAEAAWGRGRQLAELTLAEEAGAGRNSGPRAQGSQEGSVMPGHQRPALGYPAGPSQL